MDSTTSTRAHSLIKMGFTEDRIEEKFTHPSGYSVLYIDLHDDKADWAERIKYLTHRILAWSADDLIEATSDSNWHEQQRAQKDRTTSAWASIGKRQGLS